MNAGQPDHRSVFEAFLDETRDPANDEFALFHLGPQALALPFFVEAEILVPTALIGDLVEGSTFSLELVFAAAWEAVEPLARYGLTPAWAAQVLAALGGNPHRAEADPRRYLSLALSALEAFRGRGLTRHEGRAYLALGTALESCRRRPDALIAYQHSIALLNRAGDNDGLRATHARLALATTQIGLPEQALLHAEAGLRIGEGLATSTAHIAFEQAHVTQSLHLRRTRALTLLGFLADAESALADWRTVPGAGDEFDFLSATARLRLRQNRYYDAVELIVRAIDSRFARLTSPTLPGRSHYVENSARLVADGMGAALLLDRADLAIGMLAAMATRPPARPDWPKTPAHESMDSEVDGLARAATQAAVAGDAGLLAVHDDRARTILEARDAVALNTSGGATDQPMTVGDWTRAIPRALTPNELALAYVPSSENEIFVFAVTAGTVHRRTVALPADELDRLVAAALEECTRRTEPRAVHRLGEALIAPVADLVKESNSVFITAQGPLADFPFHAAPFDGRPLAVSVLVRFLPSLTHLVSPAERRATEGRGRLLRAVVATVRQPRYELLPDLPALHAEAGTVRGTFPDALVLSDNTATVSSVRAAIESCDILHLGGHAVFDPDRPNTARIMLADRPLFAFEVATATNAPRLVNLSGCRTAAERRTIGGEGEGLAASFLAIGAETVVAPLWPVRDDAALAFNSVLYRRLARAGTEVGSAVHQAQLTLLANPKFAHPGLWGAFTTMGRLRETPESSTPLIWTDDDVPEQENRSMSEAHDRDDRPETPANEAEPAPDRDAWGQSGLAGQPLTTLLFGCDEHGEEQVVDYYDPEAPPRCSHGDLMSRRAR